MMLDLNRLHALEARPALFTAGEPHFWDDPHISKGLLATHLDPQTDLASRHPETIDRSVAWLIDILALDPGATVLDLGCGPGLYALRLAAAGLDVAGVDLSQRSLDYATAAAHAAGLSIRYRCQDYLTLADHAEYDAALLIYGDFCVLPPERRRQLLANIHRALKPGGRLALDVSTPWLRRRCGLQTGWYAASAGFWRPGPHLVLERGFDYPDESIYLDQYIIVEPEGTIAVYRNWFQDYTAETITAELEANGYWIRSLWGDLTGTPLGDEPDWIGVIVGRSGAGDAEGR